jgi:hypothetical protein
VAAWRAYEQDMGNTPSRDGGKADPSGGTDCGHPAIGATDTAEVATPTDQYTTRHNPFVWFHSIIDNTAECDANVVPLGPLAANGTPSPSGHLAHDLGSLKTTPRFGFITPNLCNDGHDALCVDGRRGGLAAINEFLKKWVPLITRSPAFLADGLVIITFDESDGAGAEGSSACCGELVLPGATFQPGFKGPGGGRIGAVVLSRFVKPGTVSALPYNHYSLLRTVEEIFALPPLGYAAEPNLKVFGPDVFTDAARHPPAQ